MPANINGPINAHYSSETPRAPNAAFKRQP